MNISNYNKLKKVAKTTTILFLSAVILNGCSNKTKEEKEEDVYVHSHGSYIPYGAFIASKGVIDSNTKFGIKSANGNGYETYKPTSRELSSMKSGSFSGKTSRSVISKGSSSSSSKSFGGSSSRSFGG